MDNIGLRELRQQASDIVRRVEAGESFVVTVSGRAAARLVPAERQRWRRYDDVAEIFGIPLDATWDRDRSLVDGTVRDPWIDG